VLLFQNIESLAHGGHGILEEKLSGYIVDAQLEWAVTVADDDDVAPLILDPEISLRRGTPALVMDEIGLALGPVAQITFGRFNPGIAGKDFGAFTTNGQNTFTIRVAQIVNKLDLFLSAKFASLVLARLATRGVM